MRMEGKLQREFFTQKTLFSMLHLQYLKDLKDKKAKKKKMPFDTKMVIIISIKTNISSNLLAQIIFI